MSKLISAEFRRFWKNRIFWIEIIITVLLSFMICLANYRPENSSSEYRIYLDDAFFIFYQFIGIICAAGISLILGSEYSDGTIRNKLLIGHRRRDIYLSYLIVCTIMSFFIMLAHFVITVSVGGALFGNFQMEFAKAAYAMLCAFFVVAIFSSVCVFIVLFCQSKAAAAVVSIGLVLILIYAATFIGSRLDEPEMTHDGVIFTENGISYGDMIRNPAYVGDEARGILEFVYDLLPTGQLTQMYSCEFDRAGRWLYMSAGLWLAVSVTGAYIFKKKDIR